MLFVYRYFRTRQIIKIKCGDEWGICRFSDDKLYRLVVILKKADILVCTLLKSSMRFVRPKIIGTLKVQEMMSGTLAVINDIKNAPNKIIVPCDSKEHGQEIIKRIKDAKFGDVLHL